MEEVGIPLDGYGQMLVTIFTQISLCYPMEDESKVPAAMQALDRGLELLAASFPWLAGQVVCNGSAEGVTGTSKITPLGRAPRMAVKNLSNDRAMPSMGQLRRAGYPMHKLDEDIVAPRRTSSGRPDETTAEVFQLQSTIIKGGLILTFLGQHQCMDGVGQGQVLHLLAGETFTTEELRTGSRDPADAIRLLDQAFWTPGPEVRYNKVESLPADYAKRRMPSGIWCHFSFSHDALLTLKRVAAQGLPASTPYVSTDDALSAFIWQSIVRARLTRLPGDSPVLFARSVDIRGHVGISATYPGFAQCMTYHDKFSTRQLVDSPLGTVAADLRAAVARETSTLAYDARSLATLVSRTPDKATQDAYHLDFGMGLGLPEAVRRPRFDAFQGLVYLLPKRPDGEIGVAICLSEDDMQRLREDIGFMEFAKLVG
ncbi:hypothetical protein PG989_016560 [Apiospora arundinis]